MASVLLESRSYRPFKSSEEYLEAMREDLAEWLNTMYPDLRINAENFMNRLDTGVALCKHANNVRQAAEDYVMRRQARNKSMTRSITSGLAGPILAMGNVHYLPGAKRGTFFARDNVSNFITWCRQSLKIFECLLFETDDLIMRKNEKHVILCLLEVARRGSKFGMLAPMLVQMERQIDREIAADNKANGVQTRTDSYFTTNEIGTCTDGFDSDSEEEDDDGPPLMYGPQPQIITNDLKSLDEMVRDLVEKCTCPSQFPMVRVSEGKYRIGDTKVLIFVRILRSHVMVRVGGGWDTLAHYLDKHDPCRCKAQHRSSVAARLIPRVNNQTNGIELHKAQVIYDRSPPIARRAIVSPNNTPNSSLVSPNTTNDNSNGSTLSPPLRQSRSRSPTPQRRLKSTFADSSMKCNQATLSPSLARRSASPSPRRITEGRKKQVTTDAFGITVKPSQRSTMEGDQVEHKTLGENGANTVEGSNKFENISDNGSEISDEGYRSLGLIQTAGNKAPNVQRLESLQNQNSVDDADCIASHDQTSSDSQNPSSSSPTLESYKSDSFEAVDWKKEQENQQPLEPEEPLPKQNQQRRNSDNFVGNRDTSKNFEMSGVFITNDQITVDMGKVPTSRKNSLNSDALSNTSKIPRGPAQGKRHSIDACSDCGSDMSQRSGLPLRSKPVYRSVRKPNERKEKSKHDTWNGRGISGTTKKRPTINTDTFTSPTKDFVRNSSSRSSHNLYDENGRISRKNSSSLTTLPDKMNKTSSKNTSPLAQQLLEAAGNAKNDAQILEKMKDLLAKYSNGSFSPTNSSTPRKNDYDDFTTAWVHSNGTLCRANSCSPVKRGSFKPASEASSSESTQGRDASVIISPRRDRGPSKIPAPVSHNSDLC